MTLGPTSVAMPTAAIMLTGNNNDGSQAAGTSQEWIEPNFAAQMRDVADVMAFENVPLILAGGGFSLSWTTFNVVFNGFRLIIPAGSTTLTGTTTAQTVYLSLQLLFNSNNYVVGVEQNVSVSSNPGVGCMNFIQAVTGASTFTGTPFVPCSTVKCELLPGTIWGKAYRNTEDTSDPSTVLIGGDSATETSWVGLNLMSNAAGLSQANLSYSCALLYNYGVASTVTTVAWSIKSVWNGAFRDAIWMVNSTGGWASANAPNMFQANNSASWTTVSDVRTKEEIEPMPGTLDRIRLLHYARYKLNGMFDTPSTPDGMFVESLIADDVERVFPEAVNYHEWVGTINDSDELVHQVKGLSNDVIQAKFNRAFLELVDYTYSVNLRLSRIEQVLRLTGHI